MIMVKWLRPRALVAVVGIAAGIASLTASFNFSEAIRQMVESELRGMAPNLVLIQSLAQGGGVVGSNDERDGALRGSDSSALVRSVPGIGAASCLMRMWESRLPVNGRFQSPLAIYGVDASCEQVLDFQLSEGRFFNPFEQSRRMRVCVVGSQWMHRRRAEAMADQSYLTLFGSRYRIIGVIGSGHRVQSLDLNDAVFVPWTSLCADTGRQPWAEMLLAKTVPDSDPEQLVARIEQVLAGLPGRRQFRVEDYQELIAQRQRVVNAIAWLAGGMSMITVFVAAIGCANIMIVSVNERIREIGLRIAVGAGPMDILGLFLVEGFTMIFIAGLFGLLGGWAITEYLLMPLPGLIEQYARWRITFSSVALIKTLMVLVVSAFAGGFIPAWHACRVDPAVALRQE